MRCRTLLRYYACNRVTESVTALQNFTTRALLRCRTSRRLQPHLTSKCTHVLAATAEITSGFKSSTPWNTDYSAKKNGRAQGDKGICVRECVLAAPAWFWSQQNNVQCRWKKNRCHVLVRVYTCITTYPYVRVASDINDFHLIRTTYLQGACLQVSSYNSWQACFLTL